MMSRTVGALALCPTGNAQGGFYFLSLSTGRVLNRLRATALPMPDNVVDQVHRMARQHKANPRLLFGNRSVGTLNDEDMEDSSDDEEDDEYMPEDEDANGRQDAEDEDGPHDYNYKDTGSIASEHSKHVDDDATDMGNMNTNTDMDVSLGQSHGSNEGGMPENIDMEHVEERDDIHVKSEGVDEPNNNITHQEADDVKHMEERGDNQSIDDQSLGTVETHDETEDKMGYNLRRNRERSYKHLYDPEVFDIEKGDDDKCAIMMTTTNGGSEEIGQMSMRK